MFIQVKELCGKFFAQVRNCYADGFNILFETPEYYTQDMARKDAACWLAFHGGETSMPEPKSIRFETESCGRCGGAGRRNEGGWAANNKGRCFRCHGSGTSLTPNGYRAQQAYIKMRDELLGTTWGALEPGTAFWSDGKCYAKGNHPNLILQPGTPVRRHDGPATRQMWREIVERYKGATLVY